MSIYMILHDPILTLNINKYNERQPTYLFYNKNNLMNIEGFGSEQTPCVIIVPPPLLRNNFPYMGIKPAVYCIKKSDVNEKIMSECEKNKIPNSPSHKQEKTMINNKSAQNLTSLSSSITNNVVETKISSNYATPVKYENYVLKEGNSDANNYSNYNTNQYNSNSDRKNTPNNLSFNQINENIKIETFLTAESGNFNFFFIKIRFEG